MSKGKFYDFGWHTEYKSEKKKSYQETCIYLNDYRECENKKSSCYLSKCFEASKCTLKQKTEKTSSKSNTNQQYTSRNKSVLLYNTEDQKKIELFMNGKYYDELPPLHKVAFKHNINEQFEFSNRHYTVIGKHEYKVFEESFRIILENEKTVDKKK